MTEGLYLSYTSEKGNSCLIVGDLRFKRIELDDGTKKKIEQQLDDWEIHVYHQWCYKNLCYDNIDEGDFTKVVSVKDIANMNGWYSSEDIIGAYLVENSEFVGVIIRLNSYSGFGMDSKIDENYCIFKTNGETIGDSSERSGHCSTEVDEWSYTSYSLKHKE